jgi:hypothetical protein
LTRSAKAALERVLFDEGTLYGVEIATLRQSLDCGNGATLTIHRKGDARINGPPVHEHRTCATVRHAARDLETRQTQVKPQDIAQEPTGFDGYTLGLPVHPKCASNFLIRANYHL